MTVRFGVVVDAGVEAGTKGTRSPSEHNTF